jgi:transcriptional regulator with XRE-family HTH domain
MANSSHKRDIDDALTDSQGAASDDLQKKSGFADRLREAMGPLSPSKVARQCGFSKQTMAGYMAGSMPSADRALALADALDVPLRWLVSGVTEARGHGLIAADEADWVKVPRYRLSEFTETGKPEPVETIPLRKDWLNRKARTASKLWITELPATALEGVGDEGDDILCRDAQVRDEEGLFLYFDDGVPIVRRFTASTLGQLADGSRGWLSSRDDPPSMRLVARVLGTIKLRPL